MVVARKLDIFGSRDVLGDVASAFDRDGLVADAMENQGRQMNRRQDMADVDLIVGPQQRQDRSRTPRGTLKVAC